jgi:sulfur transfer protein SufE
MNEDKIEKEIVVYLKRFYNRDMKLKNLLEWSSSEKTIDKNLRDNENKYFIENMGLWIATDLHKLL